MQFDMFDLSVLSILSLWVQLTTFRYRVKRVKQMFLESFEHQNQNTESNQCTCHISDSEKLMT